MYDHWYADLPSLTAEQLRERRELAASRARNPGSPKNRRDWGKRLRAVEEELARRHGAE